MSISTLTQLAEVETSVLPASTTVSRVASFSFFEVCVWIGFPR